MEAPSTQTSTPKAADTLQRIAVPFCIFSMVFALLLGLSAWLVLPQLTRIEISGTMHNVGSLQQYHHNLTASIVEFEEKRSDFIEPLHHTVYAKLRQRKDGEYEPLVLIQELTKLADTLVADTDAVHIERLKVLPSNNTIELVGVIHNVGPRSMTVLAHFAEQVEHIPFIASVSHPAFSREHNEDHGFYSPFHLVLTLEDSATDL